MIWSTDSNCALAVRTQRWRRAFTLIELLLVLALVGFITAIAVPRLAGSIRSSRLTETVRRIILMGRYARSMAVMNQEDWTLVFNLKDQVVTARPLAIGVRLASPFSEESAGALPTRSLNDGEEEVLELRDAVISEFESGLFFGAENSSVYKDLEDADPSRSVQSVVYMANGRCMPYTLQIIGRHGAGVEISVDALSSAVTRRID